jgi:hypothetical protein
MKRMSRMERTMRRRLNEFLISLEDNTKIISRFPNIPIVPTMVCKMIKNKGILKIPNYKKCYHHDPLHPVRASQYNLQAVLIIRPTVQAGPGQIREDLNCLYNADRKGRD